MACSVRAMRRTMAANLGVGTCLPVVDLSSAAAQPDWDVAFQTAFDTLSRKAAALIDLPFETMDPAALKSAINAIADV